jgi:hypothetical protein
MSTMSPRLTMRWAPTLLFAVAACTSSGGAAAGSAPPLPLLLKMQQNGTSPKGILYVWMTGSTGYWEFESWEACKLVKGTLTQAELQQLQSQCDDASLDALASPDGGCPDMSYQMSAGDRVVCWSSDDATSHQSDGATVALAQFFRDRVAQLDWDGSTPDCSKGLPGGLPTRL